MQPDTLRRLLERHGIPARKSLGQHFLCSRAVVEAIVSRAEGMRGVLEIGPGPGVLTGPLAERVERVVALEVDARMVPVLAETAPSAAVELGDALDADLAALLQTLPMPRAVVSNLPYYITGPLLTRIAGAKRHFAQAVLMMQREVARRVVAAPGSSERGSLSVFLQHQFLILKVADVPPGAFWPRPKVASTVLEMTPRPSDMETFEEQALFDFVRRGFRQPRKTLENNLVAAGHSRRAVVAALELAGLGAMCRPAVPTEDQWRNLQNRLAGEAITPPI